ncbi:sodium/substrate symporter small subunit [uncultured Hyphomicrobium sp.]|uniref:sodium/substrate symporter small subunit n=1 Tax=uncultured Hyphomicrobium sp. TaxID=194373 RepID=UPI0025EDA06E|nr:sodium/substrate symporter small subunit [uncultured Hyphomicrobium sp.]
MIEIGLGLLVLAVLAATLSGVGRLLPGGGSFDLLPLIGYAGVSLVVTAAGLLIAAGLVRNALRAHPEKSRTLRSARLTTMALLAMAGLALGLPLASEAANLVRLDHTPLGYYLAAQGALIGLVVLAFIWAARQNRIDAAEIRDE